MAAPASKATKEVYKPAPPQFMIASRVGAFKSTIEIPDPFTPAILIINRAGSNAYNEWHAALQDSSPLAIVGMEMALMGRGKPTLTPDEQAIVDKYRALEDTDETARYLLPVIDRMTAATAQHDMQVEALERLNSSGKLKLSDVLGEIRGDKLQLEEAIFSLAGWRNMPDTEGNSIPFSPAMSRALLTNDTPMSDCQDEQIRQIMAGYPELHVEITLEGEDGEEKKESVLRRGLTLGRVYQLIILARAVDSALFRDQVIGAAAKNSEPPSVGINSSEGGAPIDQPDGSSGM